MHSPYSRLETLGLQLPKAPAPAANYVPFCLEGKLLFISGQLPYGPDGKIIYPGRLGESVTTEQGQLAARQSAINILAQAHAALGDLARIRRITRITGYFATTMEYIDMPVVLNGASDLLVEVLGEAGRHSRVALGCISLPRNGCVEIDAVMAVDA